MVWLHPEISHAERPRRRAWVRALHEQSGPVLGSIGTGTEGFIV